MDTRDAADRAFERATLVVLTLFLVREGLVTREDVVASLRGIVGLLSLVGTPEAPAGVAGLATDDEAAGFRQAVADQAERALQMFDAAAAWLAAPTPTPTPTPPVDPPPEELPP